MKDTIKTQGVKYHMIDPNDFPYPPSLLREVMNLSSKAVIIQNGYENNFSKSNIQEIQKTYDFNSLIIRGRPDFQVFDNDKFFLVEGKTSPRVVEAVPLLFNKLYSEKTGIPVYYAFLDSFKLSKDIPFNWIKIPKKYAEEFNLNFKHLFIEYGVLEKVFDYEEKYRDGSGDPFVLDTHYPRLELDYIKKFLSSYKNHGENNA